MFNNILIATDGSELASKAVREGISLASKTGARVTALTVLPPFHAFSMHPDLVEDTPEKFRAHVKEQSAKTLAAVAEQAKTAGVACETMAQENDHPYQAIIEIAKSKGCDLVVMASHRRHGLDAILHSSETIKVLTHSDLPVLVR